jgi:hypothetical protein
VFAAAGDPAELTTADLLEGLLALDESPWRGEWGVDRERDGVVRPEKGAPRKLSHRLRAFGVHSQQVGEKKHRRKGYRLADFADPWLRYLPNPAGGDENPLNPLTASIQAKNQRSESAHPAGVRADSEGPQTRIVEPNERIERINGGEELTEEQITLLGAAPIGRLADVAAEFEERAARRPRRAAVWSGAEVVAPDQQAAAA